jgi:Fe-S-cluster-containing dehydrogenase component
MKLGLVIDLDTCVGCHACAVACKQWNASGTSGPLSDYDPYGAEPSGVWFNRIRHYEVDEYPQNKTVNTPMSCMHCEDAACVTVCPTGASYKREEDGIVLIDQDKCMGCNYCAWACPYGARELDRESGTMKKCTLCVDRIYDENLPEAERQPACVLTCPAHARFFGDFDDPNSTVSEMVRERGGYAMMPEAGYQPTNKYLPPRQKVKTQVHATREQTEAKKAKAAAADAPATDSSEKPLAQIQRWIAQQLARQN